MRIPEKDLTEARAIGQDSVRKLLEFYEFVTGHSAYKSFISRKAILDKWNKELTKNPIGILNEKYDSSKGEIPEKRDKEVERVLKYLDMQLSLEKDTEALLAMITAEDMEKMKKTKKEIESTSIAF